MTDRSEQLKRAGLEIGDLLAEKNKAYGDAALTSAQVLKLLYPEGVPVESYTDVLLITRVWDKIKRIATDAKAFDESPWQDVAGYALLGVVKDEEQEREAAGGQELDSTAARKALQCGGASGTSEAVCQAQIKWRRERGLCIECGGTVCAADLSLCASCKERELVKEVGSQKEARDLLRQRGFCLECGGPANPNNNASLCDSCKEGTLAQVFAQEGEDAFKILEAIIHRIQIHEPLAVTKQNVFSYIEAHIESNHEYIRLLMPYTRDGEKVIDALKRIFEEGGAKSLSTGVPDLNLEQVEKEK